MQTITPYLLYEDVEAAIEFLSLAFGFEETLRFTGDEGYVNHAEMQIGDGTIMLGDPGGDYRNPSGGHPHSFVHVYVDDVDAIYDRARAAGAVITREPADQPYGDRNFGARDPQGHEWWLATHVRDVAPDDWGATTTATS